MTRCINYCHNATRANALTEELESGNATATSQDAFVQPRFVTLQGDASNKTFITDLVDRAIAIFGRLDVVASNSGWTRITNFNDMKDNLDDDLWDRTYQYNVKAH
ncbi:hypothetical protein E4T47_01100 [Aureobasidium subglaciale]|nr:hypothetical protein E4T47_01100 [Aureobasidium subglaciale]